MEMKTKLNEICLILVTFKTKAEAQTICETIVKEKLVACSNIIGGTSGENLVESRYFWLGKFYNETETLAFFKSRVALVPEIVQRVKELHSYKCPEVIAVPIIAGSQDYIEWVLENTKEPTESLVK